MRYMLDTNICIAVMKGDAVTRKKLRTIPVQNVGISGIVFAELAYGVKKSERKEQNAKALSDFIGLCQVWDWPFQAADVYGEIRAHLEGSGMIIGANDLLIAAHARFLGAVLVTKNVREFKRVPGLVFENWVSSS
jgi:tRNA(fMet)-specific endonuclease VapC